MIDFDEIERTVKKLKEQVINGDLDEEKFEDHLLEMITLGRDGYYWMYGHESEQWFRHDGQKWILADPENVNSSQISLDYHADSAMSQPAEDSPPWLWVGLSLIILILIGMTVFNSVV